MYLRSLKSTWSGIKLMHKPYPEPLPRWKIWWVPSGGPKFWCHFWTPIWHEGRGPYLSVGIGLFAFGRGY